MTKPYLSLRDRLSQVWINKYTIFLILIALKLILFHQSLQNSLKMVHKFTLDSCPAVDSYVSNSISIPHYLSKSANFMILKSIEELNEKTSATLQLILTGTENLIIFAIDMIIGTYACVLVSTVDGAVDVAVNSTEHIIGWVNTTLGEITDDIDSGLDDLSKVVNKVVSAAEKVKNLFTDDDDEDDATSSFNRVNLTISGLKNLQIPGSINTKLEKLKDSTPNFEQVKNHTETLIRTPFELVKKQVGNTTFIADDASKQMYVPPIIETKICSDNTDKINAFYNEINRDIAKILKIFVIILIIGAVVAMVPIIWEEVRTWKNLQLLKTSLDENKDPIESFETAFNKYPTKLGVICSNLVDSRKSKNSIRWIMAYTLSPRSLVVLGIALAGLLAVGLQFLILHALSRSVNENEAPFDEIAQNLTLQMDNSILLWTDSTNDFISNQQAQINDEMFSWVRTTTSSVNNTVSKFVEEMNEVISDAFNGTILYNPVKTIVGCVIENKLLKVEQGLTWIHDNAEITLPRVTEDYLSRAMSDSNSTNRNNTGLVSKSQELVSNTEDMMMNLLKTTINAYKKSLMFELYIALSILCVWALQLLIAVSVRLIDNKFDPNEVFYGSQDCKQWDISTPRQLSKEEQLRYGYPFSSPLSTYNQMMSNMPQVPPILQQERTPSSKKSTTQYSMYQMSEPTILGSLEKRDSLLTQNHLFHSQDTYPLNFAIPNGLNPVYNSSDDDQSNISDLFQDEAFSTILSMSQS